MHWYKGLLVVGHNQQLLLTDKRLDIITIFSLFLDWNLLGDTIHFGLGLLVEAGNLELHLIVINIFDGFLS